MSTSFLTFILPLALVTIVVTGTPTVSVQRPSQSPSPRPHLATLSCVHEANGEQVFYRGDTRVSSGPVRCRAVAASRAPARIVRLERVEGETMVCHVIQDAREMQAPGGGSVLTELMFVLDNGPASALMCRWNCEMDTGYRCVGPSEVKVGGECVCEKGIPLAMLVKL